jgi:hemoglobin
MYERSVLPENGSAGEEVSDFQRIGGSPAVIAVVDQFYDRLMADPQLAPFFENADMRNLRRHQVQMISQVLGGPVTYEGRDLRTAHAGLRIADSDFSRVTEYLVATLQSAQVDPEIIGRVGEALAATQADIVTAG